MLAFVVIFGAVAISTLGQGRVEDVRSHVSPKATAPNAGEAKDHVESLPPGAVARFGSARLRTTATVFALSADGKTLHSLAGARTIGRWDTETGRLLDEVQMKAGTNADCWFSPDRRSVAALDSEGVGLYDAGTGERKRTVAPNDTSGMLVAAFSPDGLTLATSEYVTKGGGLRVGRVRLFPVAGGKSKLMAELPSYVNGLAFSPDGKRLYAAVDNRSIRCFDTETAKEVWKNDHWARHLAVSPDGKMLASDTYQGGPLRLWNGESGEKIATLDTDKRSWSRRVAFSPDSKTVGFGTNDGVQIWDIAEKKLLHRFGGAGPDLAFAADSASVYTLGSVPKHTSWLNQIEIWFSILSRRVIRRGAFRSTADLRDPILKFIDYYNNTMAKPFKWTYAGRPLNV